MSKADTTTMEQSGYVTEVSDSSGDDQGFTVELDIPDDTDVGEFEDALTRVIKAASDGSDEVFADADELFAVEDLENEGIEVEWSALPGFVVTFAHVERSRDTYNKIERKYRVKNKLDGDDKLSPSVEEGLTRESLFGNSVISWRGLTVKGKAWPFDRSHYNRLWAKRRFRQWCLVQISKLGTGDSPALEAIRKN